MKNTYLRKKRYYVVVVLLYIAMYTLAGGVAWLARPESIVSFIIVYSFSPGLAYALGSLEAMKSFYDKHPSAVRERYRSLVTQKIRKSE